MQIKLSSIMVSDQDRALAFYTDVLGFVKRHDIPLGEFRWITVVSPEAPDGPELVLEPNANPASGTFQRAIFEQGIPYTAFAVTDLRAEYERLKALGVAFRGEPKQMGPTLAVSFDDTCGNLIQLYEG
ncbi:MAG TPA: VOC family protein [Longimicrobium sp.]|jgi:glyoxylase I family protein